MSKLNLNCSRLFKCDAKTLWKGIESGAFFMFTEPDKKSMKIDFKEGGSYFMEWTETECGGSVEGLFKQIIPYKKVVFSWDKVQKDEQYKTIVTLDLLEKDGATLLNLVHEGFETYELIEDHNGGWNHTMKGFMDSLEEIFKENAKEKNSLDLNARYNKTVKAPVEKVFNAVREGSQLVQYFDVNRQDNFEVGKEVIWDFDGHPAFTLNVHEVIDNQLIKFKWCGMHVCFNFREKENQETEVYLEFTTSENDQKGLNEFVDECEGWTTFLGRLKFFIEKGFTMKDY